MHDVPQNHCHSLKLNECFEATLIHIHLFSNLVTLPQSIFGLDFWAFEELINRFRNDFHPPYSKDYFGNRSNCENFIAAANLIFLTGF